MRGCEGLWGGGCGRASKGALSLQKCNQIVPLLRSNIFVNSSNHTGRCLRSYKEGSANNSSGRV